jgi:transposase
MFYVGIDVASKKHDCCIIQSDGTVLVDNFTFENTLVGFKAFMDTLYSVLPDQDLSKVKIGLESTGHYSTNLVSFLSDRQLNITVFNPLHVNLSRKAQSLRKTKTDKTDARFLAIMLFSDDSKSYMPVSYQISELKSLVRHRFRLIAMRTKLKLSISRLITILFPELPVCFSSIHQISSYALLSELPTARAISECHLTKLTHLLNVHSRGRYGKEKALQIRELASQSIGTFSGSIGFELQQTIRLIQNVNTEMDALDDQIKRIMLDLESPILTIPGISFTLGAIILSEIGDISRFQNPSKLLAFAGLEPSMYQSGNYNASKTPMVKRGSAYLRWALLYAARQVPMRDDTFKHYLESKRAQGKHYFVALSHTAKKLVRVVFHLLKTNTSFVTQG